MPNVNCHICDKEFYVKPSHKALGYGKFCSRACQHEALKKGKYVNCYACGKETWKAPKALKASKSGNLFCSKSCQTKWRNVYFSGDKHPNWKSGANKDYRKILRATKRVEKCSNCGCGDKRVLVVHHLDKDRTNNNNDNLIWLCMNCHYLVHRHNEKVNMVAVA